MNFSVKEVEERQQKIQQEIQEHMVNLGKLIIFQIKQMVQNEKKAKNDNEKKTLKFNSHYSNNFCMKFNVIL